MPKKSQTRAIIPCAGYGLRMNMDPSMSKELLIDPMTDQPLIQWSLYLCTKRGVKPLVITRAEKTDLIDYIIKNTDADLLVLNNIKGEWPNTILRSKNLWFDNNILILPDTRFKLKKIIKTIKDKLEDNNDLVFACHEVDNISKWGAIDNINKRFCEKPTETTPGLAWGLIGFKKEVGEELFSLMSHRHEWLRMSSCDFETVKLNSFTDLTRTGKIETY